jgi:hypothetical protein
MSLRMVVDCGSLLETSPHRTLHIFPLSGVGYPLPRGSEDIWQGIWVIAERGRKAVGDADCAVKPSIAICA